MGKDVLEKFRELSEKDLRFAMNSGEPVALAFFFPDSSKEIICYAHIEEIEKEKDISGQSYLYLKLRGFKRHDKEWTTDAIVIVGSGEGIVFSKFKLLDS